MQIATTIDQWTGLPFTESWGMAAITALKDGETCTLSPAPSVQRWPFAFHINGLLDSPLTLSYFPAQNVYILISRRVATEL